MIKTKSLGKRVQVISKSLLAFLGSKKFLYVVLGWFVLQAGFMAVSTSKGVPPDEGNHFRSIILYAEAGPDSFLKIDHPDAWRLQGASRTPNYLYHYMLSYPYRLLPDGMSDSQKVILLRLISIVLSLGGLIVLAKAFDLLSKNGWVRNLSLFMLTNTIMFPFISGSLNYDNLAFLLAAGIIYYFVRLVQKYRLADLLVFGTLACMGVLSKFQLLPFVAILVLLLIFHYRQQIPLLWRQTIQQFVQNRRTILLLMVPLLLFVGLFAERYAGNYLRYGTYKPQCDQVLTYEQCLRSGLFVRNLPFRHNDVKPPLPGLDYIVDWVGAMKKNIYSIVGHKRTHQTGIILYGSAVIWLAMTIAVIWKFDKNNKLLIYLLILAIVYSAALMYFNYALFAKSGRNLARQGRYLFPILGLYYFIGLHYVDRLLGKRIIWKAAISLGIILVFFAGSLPSYIYSTNKNWNTKSMEGINQSLRVGLRKLIP